MEWGYGRVGMDGTPQLLQKIKESRVFISGFNLYRFIMILTLGNWCFVNQTDKID